MKSITDIMDYRDVCPICMSPLKYRLEISQAGIYSIYDENIILMATDGANFKRGKRVLKFKKYPLKITIHKNKIENLPYEIMYNIFVLRGSCNKDVIGEEYSFMSTFCPALDVSNLRTRNLNSHFEGFTFKERIVVACVEEGFGGYYASILNDLSASETSFNLSAINLANGANHISSYKGKLLPKHFFNYKNANNTISRMRSMILLQDNGAFT